MKAYTDLSQSKKLAEILLTESADMEYIFFKEDNVQIGKVPFVNDSSEVENSAFSVVYNRVPCWSLSALFDVIPKHINGYNVLRIDISNNDFAIWYDEIGYGVNNDLPNITAGSAVDACYEMIIKLSELNLL